MPGGYDASDPEQVKRAEDEARLRTRYRRDTEHQILSTPQGREWVWQFLVDCHCWEKRMAVSGSQYEQGFFDGEREVGFGLLRRLAQSAPETFALMLREHGHGA
ncbi:MAG TPA: hypothetical protein VNF04_12185 [Stellaceae bacterium]|nr:hypothetical protein [Stellaceae bacterium]